jgi:transcriptional regulator with XRE-family HTH domain
MNLKIGAKIKALRKRDDVTQERLADVLGVTNQAISRWESENGYPDIEYITPIANFFNVSIDYLFDHDMAEKQQKIEAYCAQYETYRQARPPLFEKMIELMRHALAEFPAEETLLVKLAGALFEKWISNGLCYKTEDGYTYPDIEFHKSHDSWDEAMKISESLLASSTDDAVRAKCRYYLAMIYARTGEKEKLPAIIEKFDSMYLSKENVTSFTIFGEEGIKNNQEYLVFLLGMLGNVFFLLPEPENTKARAEACDILIDLWKFVFRGDEALHYNQIGGLYYSKAYLFQNSHPNETVEALEQAFTYAKTYDGLDIGEEEKTYISPYVNRLTYSREKIGQRNEVQQLLNNLTNKGFETLRENASFHALVKEVEAWVAK